MVSVLFALLTALCNGAASVLQRIAASSAPPERALHLSLFAYLIRRKVWLAGIGMVIVAALAQAAGQLSSSRAGTSTPPPLRASGRFSCCKTRTRPAAGRLMQISKSPLASEAAPMVTKAVQTVQ